MLMECFFCWVRFMVLFKVMVCGVLSVSGILERFICWLIGGKVGEIVGI